MVKRKSKKQLEKEISKLNNELHEICAKERDKQNKRLLGKYFKYHNSSGDDKWWLYAKVTRIEDGGVYLIKFQKTPWNFEAQEDWLSYDISGTYTEITRQEYDKAWSDFADELLLLN